MTLRAPMRCSAVAESLDEPMIGSVDQRVRWLLVEDRSAWGADAVNDVLGSDFAAVAKGRGVRVLLARRREGDPAADAVRRVMLVDTVTREMAIRTVTGSSELTMDAIADAPIAEFGATMHDPIFLVCTNGKRDACCALRGRALVGALAADHAERVWECTHLGGHRFAGNLVCLPDGIVYGRVTAADGPRLADAYLARRLDP
ncbi:MAG: sucrase ferredoxin, partial [Candidatus Limnocylindria bacterium]